MKSATAQGFTLVELLVVVTIIIIMSASILPAFSGYVTAQDLKRGQELLKSDLRSLQNKALTGASSDELVNSNKVAYWGVRFSRNTNNYDFFISDVNNTCPSSIPAAQLKGSGQLGENIVFRATTNGYKCLYFGMGVGGISQFGGLSSPLYVGYLAGPCRNVRYNAQGLIYNDNSNACP